MKIKKIEEIINIGSYKNFSWNKNTKEFAKYNFFYGWNCSGKTTLSRIFRCIELKSLHPNYPEMNFSIITDNENITSKYLSKDSPIRVFNEDFVEDNFQWNDENANIEPVLILGKEAKDLEEEIKKLIDQKAKKKDELKQATEEKNRLIDRLDKSRTEKASEIRDILLITNAKEFDKVSLEKKIETIKNNYENLILNDNEKKNKLNIYQSKKPEKITFNGVNLKISSFISKVEEILKKKVTAKQVIEKLKQNPKLAVWVREGIDLHINENTCQFCGNALPDDLFEKLNKHFSEEYDKLIQDIKNLESEITAHVEEIKGFSIVDKARLFEEFQQKFEQVTIDFSKSKDNYIKKLSELNSCLEEKKEKPFEALKFNFNVGNTENNFKKVLENIDKLINEHNLKVDSFEQEKEILKNHLINHYVAVYIKEKDYFKKVEEIKNKKSQIIIIEEEINQITKKIKEINKQIKAEFIGAERINEYLNLFFADDKLKIELTEDHKYKVYRKIDKDNAVIAKNLSTGEKNIISLAYFFAKLEEKNFDFTNGVIFIDDPVSSLDSNHIFKVYSFIAEKLKNCGQLFITTHNLEFFNLLKDLYRNKLEKYFKDANFYLIKKIKIHDTENSVIENLPQLLFKFKSEYNYLFSILKNFNESTDKSKFELLYLLPNILRRFFEAYLFMKYPDGKNFRDKADKFLKDCNNKKATLKLMNEYSHEENPTHSFKFPDIQEVEIAIGIILNEIKTKDKEHFEALNNSL